VPVGELLDALDAAAAAPGGGPVRELVVVRHPLQPVDERNFTSGALGRPGPFSADRAGLAAAEAGRRRAGSPPPFLARPLPPAPRREHVDLDDLVAALEHPARALLRQRLGVRLQGDEDDVDDRVPLDLEPLQTWAVGDRLLTAALAGAAPSDVLGAERRRGTVPPGALGARLLDDVGAKVDPLAAAARPHRSVPGRGVDVTADLPDGRSVVGTVPGVHDDVLVRAVYSRLGPKHRLRAWVQLLALTVASPGARWSSVVVGRPQGRSLTAQTARLRPPSPAVAERRLAELVELRDAALREPLPLTVAVGAAYGRSRAAGDEVVQALDAARRAWGDETGFPDPDRDLVWGRDAPFESLLTAPDRTEAAWWPEEGTRLGVLARRTWEPLLAHEEVTSA
jgi:exodeoxyribonuclease V gamma subunit